jgi:hypothetical protein
LVEHIQKMKKHMYHLGTQIDFVMGMLLLLDIMMDLIHKISQNIYKLDSKIHLMGIKDKQCIMSNRTYIKDQGTKNNLEDM